MYRYHFDLDQDFQFRVPLEIHKILLRLDKCLVCQIICYDMFLTLHCKAGGELFYFIILWNSTNLWMNNSIFSCFKSEHEFESLVDEINAGRPQCPVGLMTLVLPRKGTSSYLNSLYICLGVSGLDSFTYFQRMSSTQQLGPLWLGELQVHSCSTSWHQCFRLYYYNFVGIGSNWPYCVKMLEIKHNCPCKRISLYHGAQLTIPESAVTLQRMTSTYASVWSYAGIRSYTLWVR